MCVSFYPRLTKKQFQSGFKSSIMSSFKPYTRTQGCCDLLCVSLCVCACLWECVYLILSCKMVTIGSSFPCCHSDRGWLPLHAGTSPLSHIIGIVLIQNIIWIHLSQAYSAGMTHVQPFLWVMPIFYNQLPRAHFLLRATAWLWKQTCPKPTFVSTYTAKMPGLI